ncbi:small MutS related (smr) family protein [Tieghemostelium lacteum]|uniref:Small MutS related (Smr) family protein n=1 Tax=Tieghemostelium lacteum TaxID=361077 RepID=A0A151Z6M0_TIELA|nr:small MutS related (smr) family protein [Tieghemostelium lacteum]|eukprot:KYQ89578.1 small MutS related (smr) family protein [Tieghemostelium lacteum]
MGNCAGKLKKSKVPKEQQPEQQPVNADKASTTTTVSATQQQPPQQAEKPHDKQAIASTSAEKPKAQQQTTTTTTTTSTPSKEPFNGSKTVQVHKELHKYIIGTKGATVKEIKETSGVTNVEVGVEGGDGVKVTGTEEQCNRAIEIINNTVSQHKTTEQKDKEYKEMREEHEKESQRTGAMYKKYQDEVDSYAKKRQELNDQADKAYESGDKELAKELREQAKHQTQLMEETNKKASREIFADKNKNLDKFTVDLHGLKAKDALELMDERIEQLKKDSSNSGKPFVIIVGAGNHSDENGPKIKPLVYKSFNDRNIKFEEINNGSIQIHL